MICKIIVKLVLFSTIVGGLVACMTTNSQNNTEKSESLNETNVFHSEVKEIQSKVSNATSNPWRVKTIQLANDEDINRAYFLNEKVGFVISFNKIFRTFDSGVSWEKANFPATFGLKDIFFNSESEGFAIGYKLGKGYNHILKTNNNGRNWKVVYSSDPVSLNKISFDSNGLGWAVGERITTDSRHDTVNLVLLSNDQGETWHDSSEQINQLAKNERGWVGDSLTDFVCLENKGNFVLSLRGKIYSTDNNGKSWSLVSKLVDEPDQTGIRHFGELDGGRFWVAGGTISTEGQWGMIAVMNNSSGWDRFRLNGYYFADVKFLSNNEVIAVGSIVAPNNFGGANEQNKGVILYSPDSGKNWSIVHESQTSNEFTSIAKLSENKLFVVGQNGFGVFLEKAE